MRSAVVVFPGSNCDRDAATALARVTGQQPHMLWHGDTEIPDVDLIVLPGGFSYGDYLRTGAMAAHSPIMQEVKKAAVKGVRVLGICNGFQILCESGLLPGAQLRNKNLKFIAKPVPLVVANTDTDFTYLYEKDQVVSFPIAHGEGNYYAQDDVIKELEDEGRVIFRYADNPNGSLNDIAGITNKERNVLGLMPHPERAAEALHGCRDGATMFVGLFKRIKG